MPTFRTSENVLASHFLPTTDVYDLFKNLIPVSFSDSVQSLSERLVGPFDIEDVVDPIGVSISEGIMNFQNSGYDITGKVFQDCGTPRLQKRQVRWLKMSI